MHFPTLVQLILAIIVDSVSIYHLDTIVYFVSIFSLYIYYYNLSIIIDQ